MATPEPSAPDVRTDRRWALAVLLLGLAVNAQVVGFDFVNWDDDKHVLENRAVLQPALVPLREHLLTPYLGYPVPITVASFQLNHLLGGLDPAGYHFVNLLLFVVSSGLVYRVGRALGATPAWAAFGGAFFALHPATAETCAWVTGRKDLLAMLFLLLCLERLLVRTDRRGRLQALGWLVLSLASKPLAIAFVPVCWVVDRYVHRMSPKQSLRFSAWALLPCVACALTTVVLEQQMGAVRVGRDLDSIGDALQAGHAHLLHALVPVDLLPKYVEARAGTIDPVQLGSCVAALALLVWGFARARGPLPGAAVALAFIACTYFPVSGVMPVTRHIADTYLYGPLVGAGWLLALGASRLVQRWPERERLLVALGVALLVTLLPLRLQALEHWRDPVALWSPTFEHNAASPQVCRSLGNAFIFNYPGRDPKQLRPREAIAVYRRCLASFGRPELYLKNLGMALAMAGDFDEARRVLTDALQHKPDDATIQLYLRRLPAGR